ncbi:nuclear transport factor 2 family protein [Nocardia sp. NPDC050793]|uniref:nuclear transport factor 2 family protein n=1 Tax=Nocardia sp. NPDC050793 TaxID=3155159 RepID=UPI0033DA53DC
MADDLPDFYTDFQLPETALAVAAFRFAEQAESAVVFHHSVRAFVYARVLAERRGLVAAADYDEELLFLGCVLHDLGLSEPGNGDQRFEVDGADMAAAFLLEQGVEESRIETVWDAVALHTSVGIAGRKRPEIALTHAGTGADVIGLDRELLPADLVERVHAVLPRADIGYALTDAIVAQTIGKPGKATPMSFPGELLRRHLPVGAMPYWHDLLLQNGWGDQPAAARTEGVAGTPEELGPLFMKNLAAGDLEGLVSLYEPEATFVPAPGVVVYGTEAIRDSLRGYIEGGARISLALRKIHTVGDVAVLSSSATATGLAPGGEVLTTTTTEVVRRQPDGRWLYVVDDPFFQA